MTLTEWSIRHNRVTIVTIVFLILLGVNTYYSLPKAQDPGFTIRIATVTTAFPGASAERVEELVTDKIEEKIQEMPELDEIVSESRAGLSVINVAFQDRYTNLQPIFDDLRQKVEDVSNELPMGVSSPIINDDFGEIYGHVYSLTGEGFTLKELHDHADDVREVLLKEADVAKVELYGDIEETIYIDYNNANLTALGVTPQQLAMSIESLNILSSGGDITVGRERINIEPSGNFDTIEDLKNTQIRVSESDTLIRLGDITSIYRGYQDPLSEIVRVNGTQGVSITISLKEGGNIVTLGERLKTLMPQLESALPLGMTLKPIYMQSEMTSASVNNFVSNMIQSITIILLVMLVSLGLRSGVVVASLIPIVILSTFVVMKYFNISINQVSLAALIISLGLLVDNAIVIAEATILRREKGQESISAAIDAAKEMKVPLLISSLTTVAAFGPIGLGEGAAGEFTGDIFYVVAIALILSWLFSMTLIPLMTKFIKVEKRHQQENSIMYDTFWFRIYRQLLFISVKKPKRLLVVVILLFAVAIYGMNYLPKIFIPPSSDPMLTVKMTLPSGTDIEETERAVVRFDDYIHKHLVVDGSDKSAIGIRERLAYIGTGGARFVLSYTPPNPNSAEANMIINVNNSDSLDPMKSSIEEYFFNYEPNAKVQVKRIPQGPPFDYPIEIKVSGGDYNKLSEIASTIKQELWNTQGVTAITDDWGEQAKKVIVDIDQAKALRAGISNIDIAGSMQNALTGSKATEFREGVDVIPVVIRSQSNLSNDLSTLENETVFSQSGSALVPLSQVITPRIVWEPGRRMRLDRQLSIKIQVQIEDGITSDEVSMRFRPWLVSYSKEWPAGYTYEEGGEANASQEGAEPIAELLPFAFAAICMLLLLQFNSIRRTIIVLISIPMALIGVVFGLNVAHSYFGFFTLLGVISLAGIVINNAIVLLDRIKLEVEENLLSEKDAIIEAAQQRARPILLTTATTIGGMLPLWFSGGEMFSTMAIAILFGLLFATGITLLLVPALYSLFFRVNFN